MAYELARPYELIMGDSDELRFELSEWTPSELAESATTEANVRLGTSAADAADVYPTAYAPRCGASMAETSLTADHDTINRVRSGR